MRVVRHQLEVERHGAPAIVHRVESLTVSGLGDAQLREHAKWIATKDEKVNRAERAIAEGIKFLRRPNLAPFLQLLQRPSAKEAFWRFLKQLPE